MEALVASSVTVHPTGVSGHSFLGLPYTCPTSWGSSSVTVTSPAVIADITCVCTQVARQLLEN